MRRDGAGGEHDVVKTHLPNLLIFDRRLRCRPPAGRTAGGRGPRSSTGCCWLGVISRSALTESVADHQPQAGLPQCLWRGNEVSVGSLCIYGRSPSNVVVATKAKRSEAVGLESPHCWMRIAHPRWDISLRPVSRIARGIAHRLTTQRLKIGTRELGSSAQQGTGLAAAAGEGRYRGRSFRSSRRAGKPRTWRREAGGR